MQLIIVFFLFVASPAYATTFLINFDENNNGSIDWRGTYTITNGVLTSFSAVVGDCIVDRRPFQDLVIQNDISLCTYNSVIIPADPGDGIQTLTPAFIVVSGNFSQPGPTGGSLRLFDSANGNWWDEANEYFDRSERRSPEGSRAGTYFTVLQVPEPSPWLLLLAGLALIRNCKWRRSRLSLGT